MTDSGSESEGGTSWIDRFLSQPGNDLFVRIDEEFIEDQFNLTGLKKVVADYQEALNIILDNESGGPLEASASLLYGLIHARFITTAHGLQLNLVKMERGDFGRCRRYLCFGNPVLPIGLSDLPNMDTVKLFCPRCQEVYNSNSTLDGAFFGTSSTPMLLLANPHLVNNVPRGEFELKIYGFKLHRTAFLNQGLQVASSPSMSARLGAESPPRVDAKDAKDDDERNDAPSSNMVSPAAKKRVQKGGDDEDGRL